MAEIVGIEDFNKALAELKRDVQKRVVKSALRAAAKPIMAASKAGSKVLKKPTTYRLPGLMRDAIIAPNSRIASRKGMIGIFIKPRSKKGVTRGVKSPLDPFYYRFVAGGFHAVGSTRVKGGRLTRKTNLAAKVESGSARFIPGDDYIGKAFRSHSTEGLHQFELTIKKRIDKANRRK